MINLFFSLLFPLNQKFAHIKMLKNFFPNQIFQFILFHVVEETLNFDSEDFIDIPVIYCVPVSWIFVNV